jgi:hypothetical protein
MKRSSIYGVALVSGSLGAIITMIFHPTGHDLLGQPDEIARSNEMIAIAMHSLALFSAPLLFFGFLGFSRRLGLDHPLVSAAIVSYGFALLGGTCAAVINGLIAPVITRRILTADEATRPLLNLILMDNTLMNQAFDKIFIVSSSLAIVFWSARIMRFGRFARIVAALGCIIGLASILGLLSGHLRLNAHGFGLLIFGQMIWTILIAISLFRFGDLPTKDQAMIDS